MATRRRWLQFNLRAFFILLTVGCVWLGWKADQAHKQADAVRAIEALGGVVRYDWQTKTHIRLKVDQWSHRFDSHAGGLPWMHSLFQKVEDVYFFSPIFSTPDSVVRESVPRLKQLPWLKNVHITTSEAALSELKAALPGCDVSSKY